MTMFSWQVVHSGDLIAEGKIKLAGQPKTGTVEKAEKGETDDKAEASINLIDLMLEQARARDCGFFSLVRARCCFLHPQLFPWEA